MGLLPGVPGFSLPAPGRGPFSLGFNDGVDLEEEDRLDGGRSLLSETDPRSPVLPPSLPLLSRCSPFNAMGLGVWSSSFPTSTTRSPSLLSPLSDS